MFSYVTPCPLLFLWLWANMRTNLIRPVHVCLLVVVLLWRDEQET